MRPCLRTGDGSPWANLPLLRPALRSRVRLGRCLFRLCAPPAGTAFSRRILSAGSASSASIAGRSSRSPPAVARAGAEPSSAIDDDDQPAFDAMSELEATGTASGKPFAGDTQTPGRSRPGQRVTTARPPRAAPRRTGRPGRGDGRRPRPTVCPGQPSHVHLPGRTPGRSGVASGVGHRQPGVVAADRKRRHAG